MLLINLYKLDWLLIDSVIIILLIALLICTKIFKMISRWRKSASNDAIITIKSRNFHYKDYNIFMNLKKPIYYQNNKKKEFNKDALIIFLSNKHPKLTRTISLGLCSYGMDVALLKFKIKLKDSIQKNNNYEELKEFLFSAINKIAQGKGSKKQKILIIINSNSNNSIILFSQGTEFVLINPKMDIDSLNGNFNQDYNLNYVFSERSIIFRNKNLKKLLNFDFNKKKILIIDKSRKSFKHYESLLLGTIINICENKILN